jgi:hypothetical protein
MRELNKFIKVQITLLVQGRYFMGIIQGFSPETIIKICETGRMGRIKDTLGWRKGEMTDE